MKKNLLKRNKKIILGSCFMLAVLLLSSGCRSRNYFGFTNTNMTTGVVVSSQKIFEVSGRGVGRVGLHSFPHNNEAILAVRSYSISRLNAPNLLSPATSCGIYSRFSTTGTLIIDGTTIPVTMNLRIPVGREITDTPHTPQVTIFGLDKQQMLGLFENLNTETSFMIIRDRRGNFVRIPLYRVAEMIQRQLN